MGQNFSYMRNVVLIFSLVFFSCGTNNKIKDKIANKIDKQCINDSDCEFNIKSVTDFKWEKMYVFHFKSVHPWKI